VPAKSRNSESVCEESGKANEAFGALGELDADWPVI